ncbi:MAG: bifunctional phosphoglucose/phosphomannose isomerase [Chloroflexi bacterium]|nr:bifunctional phosphoglucose/phosphomannose isomerase [Chloroflexota bacterium]
MHILDNPSLLKQLDSEDMLSHLHRMPELCQRAWQMAMELELSPGYSGINEVVILGMGGSAIGGDLVSRLVETEAKLPVIVHRSYDLPAFVDGRTLVIASSYSGMTEETLSAFEQSLKTKSKKLAITTGGKLKALADEKGIPVFNFDYRCPPRASLPFSLLPILCFMQKLGFVSDKSPDVAEMVEILNKISGKINEKVPLSQNPAKQLAQKLHGHLAVIYGAGITSEVAHRWKTQLNENSKAWAFHEVFSELNHNAVVGYQFPVELLKQVMVVLLRSPLLSQRLRLRYEVTCQLLDRAGVVYQVVDGEGDSPLAQMMSLVLTGDYASYYLALLNNIDPSPVKNIDFLKERLADAQGS